jgi:uncharacterized protein YdeI (YjbR/CyaY-like superfamily)
MTTQNKNAPETFAPQDRKAWRHWLTRNHATSKGVWLIIQKKNSPQKGVTLEEATEEAVAFGWIDSKLNVVDEKRYKLLFSPRKAGGIWSKSNKDRVEKLLREGLMTDTGLQKVEEAKRDGSWTRLDAVEELRLPEDFKKALDESAKRSFEAFNDSLKKQILWWIESAKRQETRTSRIEQAVIMAKENRKTFPSSA